PIIVWWDYLLASEIGPSVKSLKIVIPSDASYAAYYDQAISKSAPHPAAARLWEEYLYSTTGQNLWLQGEARPIELSTLVKNGTVDQAAYKALPPAPSGNVVFPTQAQQAAAENIVAQQGSSVIGQTVGQTVQAPGSVAGPGAPGSEAAADSGPPARLTVPKLLRGLRRAAGVVPFGVYVALFLIAPMAAVAIGAFQGNDGGFTLSNVNAATHGVYLKGFWQSIILSVITSVIPGILGLMIAYAIVKAEGGNLLRQIAITAAGVFANFGGVPLAFIFIAPIGSRALVS